MDAALGAGIDWIDTAESYFDGKSELTIGAALRDLGVEVLLSSKVAPSAETEMGPAPGRSGFQPAQIREACEGSLERLGVDHLDMYLLHWPDDDVHLEDTWLAMRGLVDDGLARLVGLSNFDRQQIERCLAVGPVDLIQDGLSLIDHLEHRELFRWCEERGIGVVTYEPLANGMLTGAIGSPDDFVRVVGEDYREWGFWKRLFSPGRFERAQAVVDGMRVIAEDIGCTLAQLALAWNLRGSGVTATLAGSRNPVHVRENAEAASIELTDTQLAQLDDLVSLGPTFV